MSHDPLKLVDQLVDLRELRSAAEVLEMALFREPGRREVRQRFDELLKQLPADEARKFHERQAKLASLSRAYPKINPPWIGVGLGFLLLGLGTLANSLLLMAVGSAVGGLAYWIVLWRIWQQRRTLEWRGWEIQASERPAAYLFCLVSLGVFASLFVFGGVNAIAQELGVLR
jgi:hypothetical protein